MGVTMRVLLILPVFLSAICCDGQPFRSKLDHIVHGYDTAGGFNGVVILATAPQDIRTYAYGYKDPASKRRRIDARDRFDLASLTKQFTAMAILQLIEQGSIGPDDSIGRYFPELQPALRKVTIRQLANHTSGIHDFYALTSRHESLSVPLILGMLSRLDTTAFPPGSKWGYTNSGYVLLSTLIERVTKMPFEAYCEKHVLSPLGMCACFAPLARPHLSGYTAAGEQAPSKSYSSGEAGLYASARDMIAYYRAVSTDTARWRRYFRASPRLADQSNEEGWTYGFGWYFSEDSTGRFRAHSGRNPGAYTYLRWYDDGRFVCLLSNKNDEFIRQLREEIVSLLNSQ
jgi:CubicO group peptidase (beta-lactamase class C family)